MSLLKKALFFTLCIVIFLISISINFYNNTHTILMYNSYLLPHSYYVLSIIIIIFTSIILSKIMKIKLKRVYLITFIIFSIILLHIATNLIVSKDEVVYKNLHKPLSDEKYHENNPNSIIKIRNLLKENDIELTDISYLTGKKNNVNVLLLINDSLIILTDADRTVILDKLDVAKFLEETKNNILKEDYIKNIEYLSIYGYKVVYKNGDEKRYRFNVYFEGDKIKVLPMEM